eukprot:TRINITY_DN754_c5_g1_i1.p1 TRINITY_DN754_c5_g1~~TRINITY_DN754_c5_g1_i1.p1  ORF type:complete len:4259 (+),score=1336.88 TRINITY_DN754_c5_g1_i1:96-12872(+)
MSKIGAGDDTKFGVKIRPDAILRNILQQYPSGGQFFLEALQNSDDTGRADNFRAMLDLRKHSTANLRPPAAIRSELQGESIIFYDDAGFKDRDWVSLQNMCDSQKRQTPYETGAFGMGSRAYFHMTDCLQVVSGKKLALLDPADLLETGHFGEEFDVTEAGWLQKNPSDAAPFIGMFGCTMKEPLKGTIIRAPLRMREKSFAQAFGVDRATKIFNEFEDTLKNGEVILFLSCVKCAELWRWENGAKEPTLSCRARLGVSSGHTLPKNVSTLRDVRKFLQQFETFEQLDTALDKTATKKPEVLELVETTTKISRTGEESKQIWLRYGFMSDDKEAVKLGISCLCVPYVTLAVPVGGRSMPGRIFNVQPLPMFTHLPIHVNAAFKMHANRRGIWRRAEDLEGEHKTWAMWNEKILTGIVPMVYSKALEWLASQNKLAPDGGHLAWPDIAKIEKDFACVLDPLVAQLGGMKALPMPVTGKLVKSTEAFWFPTPTPALQACRQNLLKICVDEGHTVIDPPMHVVELLHSRGALEKKTCKWILLEVVIPAAAKLEEKLRAKLFLAYVEWVSSWPHEEIVDLATKLADVKWVPTNSAGSRTIADSFDPENSPDALGIVRQRRAKIGELMKEAGLTVEAVWRVLRQYGLKSEITWADAVEEAQQLVKEKNVPGAGKLFEHIDKQHSHFPGDREGALDSLKKLPWVPATKPGQEPACFQSATPKQLLALGDVYPVAQHKYVWAVAPALAFETEPVLVELRAVRNTDVDAAILVKQITVLSEAPAQKGSKLNAKTCLEQTRVVFEALPPPRMMPEVIIEAAKGLKGLKATALFLTFLEWAGQLQDSAIKDLGKQMANEQWMPVEDGSVLSVIASFDPVDSPDDFEVVRKRRAKVASLISEIGLDNDTVWRVLRLAGIKRQISWEDAVEEAESVVKAKDLQRSKKLFSHVDAHHVSLRGDRAKCLDRLQKLAWVPATKPGLTSKTPTVSYLLLLKDVFGPTSHKMVWAVSPSLVIEAEPQLQEFSPGRTIDKEPNVLVEQVLKLLSSENSGAKSEDLVADLRAVFAAMAPGRIVSEVVIPAAAKLAGPTRTKFLAVLFEFVKDWDKADLKDLAMKAISVVWIPTVEGVTRSIKDCFDPNDSPGDFSIVRKRKAQLAPVAQELGLQEDSLWTVLRGCGLKQQITWQDASFEAESIVRDKDVERAEKLFLHLDAHYTKLPGDRGVALKVLQRLAWIPATKPGLRLQGMRATQLLPLRDVFPQKERKLVFAVAPTLYVDGETTMEGLTPARSVESHPNILVDQTAMLVKQILSSSTNPTLRQTDIAKSVEHLQAVFGAFAHERMTSQVIVPASGKLKEEGVAYLMVAYLAWAHSWREAEITELGQQIAQIRWVPTEDNTVNVTKDSFELLESPNVFSIVKKKRAKINHLIADVGAEAANVWKVLRLCGIKTQITWEDAVEESLQIVRDKDVKRAGQLFAHLNKYHDKMQGGRSDCLEKLRKLAWAPATEPSMEPDAQKATQMVALQKIFPPSAHGLIWAVAPCLYVDCEPTLHELQAGRTVESEPEVIIDQVRKICNVALHASINKRFPPGVTAPVLQHLINAYAALAANISKLPDGLAGHEKLKDVAFIPCLPTDDKFAAVLFKPTRCAFHAQHDHRSLMPVLGIVRPGDATVKMIAEAVNVPQEPIAETLAEILREQPVEVIGIELGIRIATELAARIRAGERMPPKIVVPTSTGLLEPVEQVYIDDASWKKGEIQTLHHRISAEDGRVLGCTSVRAEMANMCEEVTGTTEGDTFGQEADLVSQIKQLLQEYGEGADLVKEFVQNSDDAGCEHVVFILEEVQHPAEQLVDTRTAALQGPALYVCSDKVLTGQDIKNMQRVGHSKKRMDFFSSGRFGVGLNVMYRYCDCPQLLANDSLHFFDLTQAYVAQPGMRRGRKFTTDKFKEVFPDSYAPFLSETIGKFPTVFRLPLRIKHSELGTEQDIEQVRGELQQAAAVADKMLLFARNLRTLEFYDSGDLLAKHASSVREKEKYDEFFKSLPATPLELKPGVMHSHLTQKIIETEFHESAGAPVLTTEWAITHRVGVTNEDMYNILKAQYEKPHGVALPPHGAAAVRVKPFELDPRSGRICSGMPTPFYSNSSAWIHGGFALLSSRKSLPLPDGTETADNLTTPLGLDKVWNQLLVDGPIAEAIHGLIVHCSGLVLYQGLRMDQYYALFPVRGDALQTRLAKSTFKAAMNSAIFPVVGGTSVSWMAGPAPTFFSTELHESIQRALVQDGLKLVSLPPELLSEYEQALGKPCNRLNGAMLMKFLKDIWKKKFKGKNPELFPEETGLACLSIKEAVVLMCAFVGRSLWRKHVHKTQHDYNRLHNFSMRELEGVPLLVTHEEKVTCYQEGIVKFCTWRDMLPDRRDLFVDRGCHAALMDSVDALTDGLAKIVDIDLPFVRVFELQDLVQFKEDVESAVKADESFAAPENGPLRLFWSLIAEHVMEETRGENPIPAEIQWHEMVPDWKLLPVCADSGNGENGETCIEICRAGATAAMSLIDSDAEVAESLMGILQECGIATLQPEMLTDERIANIIKPFIVYNVKDMLALIIEHGNVDALSGAMRHELLAFFSVVALKGAIDINEVALLPLFRTAQVESAFTALTESMPHCCIDPTDPHASILTQVVPPGIALLAWPTQQVKPIYEHFGINLCSAQDFMISYIIPELPFICKQDPDGASAEPFLNELYSFVCIDGSTKVRDAAAVAKFVPSQDGSWSGAASEFISPAGSAAAAFNDTLSNAGYLPARWMQNNPQFLELLHVLGMSMNLPPPVILICAQHLDRLASSDSPLDPKPAPRAPDEVFEDNDEGMGEPDEDENALEDQSLALEGPATSLPPGEGGAKGSAMQNEIDPLTGALVAKPMSKKKARKADNKHAITLAEKKQELVPSAPNLPFPEPDWTKPKEVNENMRIMSYELVEEFARAAAELWPTGGGGGHDQDKKAHDIDCLLEAGTLKILMARKFNHDRLRMAEVKTRNITQQPNKKARWQLELDGKADLDLELVSFGGVTFLHAANVLWTVCPVADHQSHASISTNYLKQLIFQHKDDMCQVFGSFVLQSDAPVEAVLEHLIHISSHLQLENEVASVKPGSFLHSDFQNCWLHLSDHVDKLRNPEMLDLIGRCQERCCISVAGEDVADKPAEEILLTKPRFAFYHLPLLRGKEANLRLYLRQVNSDSAKETQLFKALGARDRPGAADYATASQRVAYKARTLGRVSFEWVVAVLEACMRGFHEDVAHLLTEGMQVTVDNLHLLTSDGGVEEAKELIWADVPRWTARCKQETRLRFCALRGKDDHTLATDLVRCAGLKELSSIVTESRLTDLMGGAQRALGDGDGSTAGHMDLRGENSDRVKALRDRVQRLLASWEFASGLRAVIVHTRDKDKPGSALPIEKVREEMRAITFQIVSRLRSGLFWIKGKELIEGSEQMQQVYYDTEQKMVLFDNNCTAEHDAFATELGSALRRALPILQSVDGFLLEALLRTCIREGPSSIAVFLEKHDIKVGSVNAKHVGPGDRLPNELQDHVVWAMDSTFSEGECATMLVNDVFVVVEVAKWPSGTPLGEGLSRSYRVKNGLDSMSTIKHFELYKIHGGASPTSGPMGGNDLVPDGMVRDVIDGESPEDEDARRIAEVKRYLHEMGAMPPDEYKQVMRRLFKTWHPDKVGDTPLSNTIFRMLRRHEQWYKKKQAGEAVGDDSWLHEDDEHQKPDKELLALENDPAHTKDMHGTWFDEFEQEMEALRREEQEAMSSFMKGNVVVPPTAGTRIDMGAEVNPLVMSSDVPGRVVDRAQAPKWLHQGKLELLAACVLLKPVEGLRSLPAAAVWHCEQAVEMAIKSAMFRTCGISEDESIGGAAHDITAFVLRLRNAGSNTEEQRRAQCVPINDEDIEWLRKAYLGARYPRAYGAQIPAELYNKADAERAIRIADAFLKWAGTIEDLPDPGTHSGAVQQATETMMEIRKRRWTQMAGGPNVDVPSTGGRARPELGAAVVGELGRSDLYDRIVMAVDKGKHDPGAAEGYGLLHDSNQASRRDPDMRFEDHAPSMPTKMPDKRMVAQPPGTTGISKLTSAAPRVGMPVAAPVAGPDLLEQKGKGKGKDGAPTTSKAGAARPPRKPVDPEHAAQVAAVAANFREGAAAPPMRPPPGAPPSGSSRGYDRERSRGRRSASRDRKRRRRDEDDRDRRDRSRKASRRDRSRSRDPPKGGDGSTEDRLAELKNRLMKSTLRAKNKKDTLE